MSVLIKGMDMPKDGRYTMCVTHSDDGKPHIVIQNQDTLEFIKHGEVVEVPTPHGRLIDESKIKKCGWNFIDHHAKTDAPTVIEAEVEE